MNRDYFKGIYEDFFGIENSKELTIEVENTTNEETEQEEMTEIIDKINNLYVDETSKNLLKNIVEYMRKWKDGLEKNYIPFRLIVNSNGELIKEVENILYKAASTFNYLDSKDKHEISFYHYDKSYSYKDDFIILKDLVGLKLEDIKEEQRFFYVFENFLKEKKHNMVIISGTSDEINNFFLGYESLKNNYFDFVINGISPSIAEIYEKILLKLDIDETLKGEVLTYVENTYNESINYENYIDDLVKFISFNKKVPEIKTKKSLDEIFKELNELVGLIDIKKVLYEMVDVIKLKEKTKGTLNIKDMNLHMVFLGNPGTGKTTIARLISSILYELGIIKENKLVEVGVKDLVAEYVGQTAPKTSLVIEKSLNGVLFIDEAYALASKDGNSYNDEAIATLIQAMENYRDKLVVIFAGYTKEMNDFLDSNSGIVSRIGYTMEFPDYTTDELIEIFLSMTKKAGFEVESKAIDYLKEIIEENRHMKNFGNARFIRNIYEKTVVKHASRVKDKKQNKILRTITHDDISIENLNLK